MRYRSVDSDTASANAPAKAVMKNGAQGPNLDGSLERKYRNSIQLCRAPKITTTMNEQVIGIQPARIAAVEINMIDNAEKMRESGSALQLVLASLDNVESLCKVIFRDSVHHIHINSESCHLTVFGKVKCSPLWQDAIRGGPNLICQTPFNVKSAETAFGGH